MDTAAELTPAIPGEKRAVAPHNTVRDGPKRAQSDAMGADSYADMLERLFADYEHKHPLPVIKTVAAAGRDDLAGQTTPGAELELLERLVRQRLDQLPAIGPA